MVKLPKDFSYDRNREEIKELATIVCSLKMYREYWEGAAKRELEVIEQGDFSVVGKESREYSHAKYLQTAAETESVEKKYQERLDRLHELEKEYFRPLREREAEKLEGFRQEFIRLDGLRDELAVDKDLADLMTRMEREFHISQLTGHHNKEVMELYKLISGARS